MPHSGELKFDKSPISSQEKAQARIKAQMDWEAEVISSVSRWQIDNGLRRFAPDDNSPKQAMNAYFGSAAGTLQTSPGSVPIDYAAVHPFQYDVERIMRQYNTGRFYASLSDERRRELVRGRLSFSGLTQDQRQLAAFLAPNLYLLIEETAPNRILLGLRPKVDPARCTAPYGIPVRLAVAVE
jgi:hypothetical protein